MFFCTSITSSHQEDLSSLLLSSKVVIFLY